MGKSFRQAVLVDKALAEGKRVYYWAVDPEKRGLIVDVTLPENLKTPRRIEHQKDRSSCL